MPSKTPVESIDHRPSMDSNLEPVDDGYFMFRAKNLEGSMASFRVSKEATVESFLSESFPDFDTVLFCTGDGKRSHLTFFDVPKT